MKTSVKCKAFALIVAVLFISVFLVIYPLNKTPTTIVNISIDDVELSMKDLYENPKYKSLFEQPFFRYLKDCHEKYNCTFTLYLYANMGGQYSNKFKKEFLENKDWLQFGFHAVKPVFDKAETSNIIIFSEAYEHLDSCIEIFAGPEMKASALRLHYYYATPKEISFLHKKGINRLLAADDDRISYSLPKRLNDSLRKANTMSFNGMNYRRTNLRMEKMLFPPVELRNLPNDTIVFFTHECQLNGKRGKLKLDYCLWFFNKQKCKFRFV